MILQLFISMETLATELAGKWRRDCMVHFVNFQVCLREIPFITHVTSEWSLGRMSNLLVFLQQSWVFELLVTQVTAVVLLSRVILGVALQIGKTFEALVTEVTLVGPLFDM